MASNHTELKLHWAIRLRKRLLLSRPSRWNAWVRDVTAWLERPWDRCRYGHSMWTKGGYTTCRKHGGR